jgi:Uma2 family endonuclease
MEVVTKFSDLDLTKQYSFSDYLKWEFTERVELLRGFIHKMSPAPNRRHQTVSQRINNHFYNSVNCAVFVAPFDVRLPIASAKKQTTVVQPDICIICDANKLDDLGCNGAPDLIVEILSPKNSKYDTNTKFNLYQEAGVNEYWIVDIEQKMILVYTLLDGIYIGLKPASEDENVKSIAFPHFKLAVADVFVGL